MDNKNILDEWIKCETKNINDNIVEEFHTIKDNYTRKEIDEKFQIIENKINKLDNSIIELKKEIGFLSDRERNFYLRSKIPFKFIPDNYFKLFNVKANQ